MTEARNSGCSALRKVAQSLEPVSNELNDSSKWKKNATTFHLPTSSELLGTRGNARLPLVYPPASWGGGVVACKAGKKRSSVKNDFVFFMRLPPLPQQQAKKPTR
ncbi:MAG: hypothetical protein M0Q93_11185, partial [Terrimicrobiaceae bacterium]|nr:hypothetical protein [Terrimicrobiaceae bacterium]